ncbi:MAG: hypothetical protein QXY45_01860 [Candidatus Aenigmatarchaeota archaeon]
MGKKLKGKEWYSLIAPKYFDNKVLGETPVGDPETAKNRVVSVSAMNLINDPSKYHFKFSFKVNEIKDNKLYTDFHKVECLRDYISRMIRHGILRIDNNIVLTTKDGYNIRVKTVTIVSKKAKREVELALRKFIDKKLEEQIKSGTIEDFVQKLLNDSIKRSIIDQGNKIYPIHNFIFRKVERIYTQKDLN